MESTPPTAVGHSTEYDQSRVTAEKRPRTPALPRVSAWNDAPKAKKELAITCDFFPAKTRDTVSSTPLRP